jgi:hypothetical protein
MMSWHCPDIKESIDKVERILPTRKIAAAILARKMRQKKPIVTRKSAT